MKNKKWTVRFATEDGNNYVNIIGNDVRKVIDYVCKEKGIEATAIDYLSSEEVIILD